MADVDTGREVLEVQMRALQLGGYAPVANLEGEIVNGRPTDSVLRALTGSGVQTDSIQQINSLLSSNQDAARSYITGLARMAAGGEEETVRTYIDTLYGSNIDTSNLEQAINTIAGNINAGVRARLSGGTETERAAAAPEAEQGISSLTGVEVVQAMIVALEEGGYRRLDGLNASHVDGAAGGITRSTFTAVTGQEFGSNAIGILQDLLESDTEAATAFARGLNQMNVNGGDHQVWAQQFIHTMYPRYDADNLNRGIRQVIRHLNSELEVNIRNEHVYGASTLAAVFRNPSQRLPLGIDLSPGGDLGREGLKQVQRFAELLDIQPRSSIDGIDGPLTRGATEQILGHDHDETTSTEFGALHARMYTDTRYADDVIQALHNKLHGVECDDIEPDPDFVRRFLNCTRIYIQADRNPDNPISGLSLIPEGASLEEIDAALNQYQRYVDNELRHNGLARTHIEDESTLCRIFEDSHDGNDRDPVDPGGPAGEPGAPSNDFGGPQTDPVGGGAPSPVDGPG